MGPRYLSCLTLWNSGPRESPHKVAVRRLVGALVRRLVQGLLGGRLAFHAVPHERLDSARPERS
jgi:hypothetical protein